MLLESFTPNIDGGYQCHITTVAGDVLFGNVVHSDISRQTLEILQKAINPVVSRQKNCLIGSTFTISKCLDYDHDADTVGFEHDTYTHTLDLCVRIRAPSARDLSGSLGISRNDWLDICAPELVEATQTWSPRDFYDNVHVPKSEEVTVPDIDELQCTLYPFQKRALMWLLRREGAVYDSQDKPVELSHGFVSTTDADGKQCFVSRFLGMVTADEEVALKIGSDPIGGILCQEMGLGT